MELKFIKSNDNIAVALSGGKDSVTLLHMLLSVKERFNLKICAVNVEHGIRGEASVKDSEFCKTLCEKWGVKLYSYSCDAPSFCREKGYSLEQGARLLRYGFFDEIIKKGLADKIATAHHLSDDVETVLFNLFRGGGSKGLTGINGEKEYIIRPLIDFKREDIDEYIEKNSLPYVTDESNFDGEFSRNFIRLEVLPLIKSRFPFVEESVKRTKEILGEEEEFLSRLTSEQIEDYKGGYRLKSDIPTVLFKRAVIEILKKMGVVKDYEKVHADDVYKIAKESGKRVNLPRGIVAVNEYGYVVFSREDFEEFYVEYPFKEGVFDFKKFTLTVSKEGEGRAVYLGEGNYVIRSRKTGDKILYKKCNKSVKKLLIEEKIPVGLRDYLPVIAIGEKVLTISDKYVGDGAKSGENKYYIKVEEKDGNL